MMNFGRKLPIFLQFFANSWKTHPCVRKTWQKRDPCLETFGPQDPPMWAAHTVPSTCYVTPQGHRFD